MAITNEHLHTLEEIIRLRTEIKNNFKKLEFYEVKLAKLEKHENVRERKIKKCRTFLRMLSMELE